MASTYLGPEKPAPFSVISERYSNALALPTGPEFDEHRFGDVYEEEMFKLIHKYLELGTTDKLCYVGEKKGSFELLIAKKFCLINQVDALVPIKSSPVEGRSLSSGGGKDKRFEEHFLNKASECQARKETIYDRVLVMDSLKYVYNPDLIYRSIKSCLDENGVLVLIHRAGIMNTLPLFHNALKESEKTDVDILEVVKDLKSAGFDVQWEIELIPVIMPKVKWLSMIKDQYPTQLESATNIDMLAGLRELSEGMFKYEGELVEFTDRLLFITATPMAEGMPASLVQRYGKKGLQQTAQQSRELKMEVDREVSRLIKHRESPATKRTNALW